MSIFKFLKKKSMINDPLDSFLKIYFHLAVVIYFLLTGIYPVKLNAQTNENWWLQSSLADTITQMQFHASANYSYTRMKGIISGTMNSGKLSIVLRKGVFTNFSRYGNDQLDLNLKSSVRLNYRTKSEYFTDYVDVDLSKSIFAEGGYIWEKDDALLLKSRNTFYGGMGLNISFLKKLSLKSMFASGGINQEFTIPVENSDLKKPYAAFYSVHDIGYKISPETFIFGKFYYFSNLNDQERFRYGWLLNLSVSLWKHVKLVTGYHYKFDRDLKLLGLIPDNSTQNIGIEISL
jgi:hypothetical protein